MRLVLETTICDACLAWKGAEVDEGVERVDVVAGSTLDLCPEHREGTSRVFALLAEFGTGAELVKATRKRAAAVARVAPTNGAAAVAAPAPNRRGGKRARARRNNSAPVARVVEVAEGVSPVGECPLCGHVSPTTSALGMHLRQTHATTVGEIYGRVCPLCEAEAATTGALGVHGATTHGIERGTGVVGLFARARNEGDPLGVIASRATAIVEAASQ